MNTSTPFVAHFSSLVSDPSIVAAQTEQRRYVSLFAVSASHISNARINNWIWRPLSVTHSRIYLTQHTALAFGSCSLFPSLVWTVCSTSDKPQEKRAITICTCPLQLTVMKKMNANTPFNSTTIRPNGWLVGDQRHLLSTNRMYYAMIRPNDHNALLPVLSSIPQQRKQEVHQVLTAASTHGCRFSLKHIKFSEIFFIDFLF